MTSSPDARRKHLRRSALLGLLSLGLHVAATFVPLFMEEKTYSGEDAFARFQADMNELGRWAMAVGVVGNLVAIAGVVYAVKGSRGAKMGFLLIAAWLLNILGLGCAPFLFVAPS